MKHIKTLAASLSLLWLTVLVLPAHALDAGVENLRQTGKAFAAVAREVSPSVVFIRVEGKASATAAVPFSSPFGDDFPDFQQPPRPEQPQGERRVMGQGSGFVFKTNADRQGERRRLVPDRQR